MGSRIERLRHSVDSANRQIIDLKQGALTAKAAQREHCNQACLNSPLSGYSAIEKAETLIAKVIGADDGPTQNEIPSDI